MASAAPTVGAPELDTAPSWGLLTALEVFSSHDDSVALLFSVRKKKDITAGKTRALEREDVFKMNTNKCLLKPGVLALLCLGGISKT